MSSTEFARRRKQLMRMMGENSIAFSPRRMNKCVIAMCCFRSVRTVTFSI